MINELVAFEAFLETKTQKQGEQFGGNLTSSNYWKKLAYLLRRPSKFSNLIDIHLRDNNQLELLSYLKATLSGDEFSYEKDLYLLSSNLYYRQFVLILERKCLEFI